jgi:hypothetical protein
MPTLASICRTKAYAIEAKEPRRIAPAGFFVAAETVVGAPNGLALLGLSVRTD